MRKALDVAYWVGLTALFMISVTPIFGQPLAGKSIVYGRGLGDAFYVAVSLGMFILFAVSTVLKIVKENAKAKAIVVFLLYSVLVFLFYSFTVGRGVEYRWNGEVLVP